MVLGRAIFLRAQLTHFCAKRSRSLRKNVFLSQELHENKQKYISIVKYDIFDKIIKN